MNLLGYIGGSLGLAAVVGLMFICAACRRRNKEKKNDVVIIASASFSGSGAAAPRSPVVSACPVSAEVDMDAMDAVAVVVCAGGAGASEAPSSGSGGAGADSAATGAGAGAGVVAGAAVAGAVGGAAVVAGAAAAKRDASTTICLLNKQVSRVLLQNQTFMTTVRSEYCVPDGTPSGALSPSSLAGLSMPRDKVHAFARDFSVVPQLCSARQLDAVFDSVNNCQDADDDADALDGLEFNETLVRLGVLYGPGCDARFLNVESLEDDTAFATALFQFLLYLHEHRNRGVPALEALPVPRVKGLAVQ